MIPWLKKIGEVPAIPSVDVESSRIGIGFEKLDRAVFDPEKAYDKVAALGVKWVRLQSGWLRTETEKGVYHFEWLDEIVDNLRARGLEPWICLCYSNGLYVPDAAERFGAVGCPPIQTPEQRKAWHDYVRAAVTHFRGRVTWWEIWNEPDGGYAWREKPDAHEYTEFAKATARAIREASADAKIIGGVFAMTDLGYISTCFADGLGDICDAVTFHLYSPDETDDGERIANLKALIAQYKPKLRLIQGEGGCQSRGDGSGALANQAWTREKQAKSLSRHLISQLEHNVMFTSYFSCMDMIEALNGKVGDKASYLDYGYFGVLGADFDENGVATGDYTPKPSYRALQVIAAVFRGDFTPTPLPVESWGEPDGRFGGDYINERLRNCYSCGFRRPNGATAFAYWKKTNLLRETFEGSISLRFPTPATGVPKLVDMLDGAIYELKADQIQGGPNYGTESTVLYHRLPLFDHPMLLVFGDFF